MNVHIILNTISVYHASEQNMFHRGPYQYTMKVIATNHDPVFGFLTSRVNDEYLAWYVLYVVPHYYWDTVDE